MSFKRTTSKEKRVVLTYEKELQFKVKNPTIINFLSSGGAVQFYPRFCIQQQFEYPDG